MVVVIVWWGLGWPPITMPPRTAWPNHPTSPCHPRQRGSVCNPGPWYVIEPPNRPGNGLRVGKDVEAGAFWASKRSAILPPAIKENPVVAPRIADFWGNKILGGMGEESCQANNVSDGRIQGE